LYVFILFLLIFSCTVINIYFIFIADYQQLILPNNFPKAFPEAPIAGQQVRLECVAFA
jgi:hypothetical protein